jgi:hypothetical protein
MVPFPGDNFLINGMLLARPAHDISLASRQRGLGRPKVGDRLGQKEARKRSFPGLPFGTSEESV